MKKILLIVIILIVGCSKPINDDTLISKDGLKYIPYTKELYSGKVFKNYMGGKKQFEGIYMDGEKYGLWKYYTEDGKILSEISFPVTDIDGNSYKIEMIGKQIWIVENLKVTHYRNGNPIPNLSRQDDWNDTKLGAYCNYDNDEKNVETYGRLYNWYAVIDKRGLAPKGWHIPTMKEWNELINYLGGSDVAGGKLQEAGGSGFKAQLGGKRPNYGKFGSEYYFISFDGEFWSSTGDIIVDSEYAISYGLTAVLQDSRIKTNLSLMKSGFSILCVRD